MTTPWEIGDIVVIGPWEPDPDLVFTVHEGIAEIVDIDGDYAYMYLPQAQEEGKPAWCSAPLKQLLRSVLSP